MRRPLVSAVLLASLTGCAQCPDPFAEPAAPPLTLLFPTGLALHPTLPILFVASSNRDQKYATGSVLAARLDWLVADINLRGFIPDPIEEPWQTSVLVPQVGSSLALTPDGNYLFHVSQVDAQIQALDVEITAEDVQLSCGSAVDRTKAERPVPTCFSGPRVVQARLQDPYDIVSVRGDGNKWRAYISFLRNGFIQALDLDPSVAGSGRFTKAWDLDLGGNVLGGNLAILPSDGGQPPYLWSLGRTQRSSNQLGGAIHLVNLWEAPFTTPLVADTQAAAGSWETRGVAFNKALTRAYVVSKSPPALLEFDITRLPDGVPHMEMRRLKSLGKEPSHVALYEPEDGPPLIITTSGRDDFVMAVDATSFNTAHVIRGACAHPLRVVVDNKRALAFVSCYDDDVVAVLSLPRFAGDDRFRVAARLGKLRNTAATNPDVDQYLPNVPLPGL
jgi:hypothetical protein